MKELENLKTKDLKNALYLGHIICLRSQEREL